MSNTSTLGFSGPFHNLTQKLDDNIIIKINTIKHSTNT